MLTLMRSCCQLAKPLKPLAYRRRRRETLAVRDR